MISQSPYCRVFTFVSFASQIQLSSVEIKRDVFVDIIVKT